MKFNDKEIKVVWVDLDDTMIDFRANSRHALHRLWGEEPAVRRCFETDELWIDVYEKHNHRLWELYGAGKISRSYLRMERFMRPLCEGGMNEDDAKELAERYDILYLDFLAQEKQLIAGSIDLLRMLRESGVKIGCLSNGFKDVQFRKIRNCGLEPWFDLVVLSDDIGINKPDVRLFRHAQERSGCPEPTDHLMIGDNAMTDIKGSKGAGWSAIQFHRMPEDAVAECADACVERLADILELLRGDESKLC